MTASLTLGKGQVVSVKVSEKNSICFKAYFFQEGTKDLTTYHSVAPDTFLKV